MKPSGHRTSLSRIVSRVVAWATVPLFMAGMGSIIWLEHRLGLAHESPLEDVMVFIGFGAFAVVGSLLVAKRPSNPVSWIIPCHRALRKALRDAGCQQHMCGIPDCGERIPQLVAQHGKKLVLGMTRPFGLCARGALTLE